MFYEEIAASHKVSSDFFVENNKAEETSNLFSPASLGG